MADFKIKINKRYISGFKESDIKATNGGGGHYQYASTHNLTIPIFNKDVMIFRGYINLKSYLDLILRWEKKLNKTNKLEIIKCQ